MGEKSFPILVPYKGEMVIAAATEVENPVQLYYQVSFPDGSSTLVHNYEGDRGWAEAELDITDLARDIGPVIDMYRHKKYFEPSIITVNQTPYAIQPFTEDEGNTIKYEIYTRSCEHLVNIFIGRDGEWEFEQVSGNNNPGYHNLAKEIGAVISG
jgi:hypothetical protein